MLDWLDPNPVTAIVKVVAAIAIVGMAIAVWFQLDRRARSYGGGVLAGIVVGIGLVVLLISLIPNVMPFEFGIAMLFAAFVFIYRPEVVVQITGGPRKEWRALREGRELAVLVAERGGPRAAKGDPEISARVAGLSKLETASTRDYLSLVRQTLFADPSDSALDGARSQLAAADAALRERLGARPSWERALERRARGEAPAE